MDKATAYQTLGVPEGGGVKAIRSAYRKLVHRYHPDALVTQPQHIQDEGENKMKDVNEAYETFFPPNKETSIDHNMSVKISAVEDGESLEQVFARIVRDLTDPNPEMFSAIRLPKQDIGLLTILLDQQHLYQNVVDYEPSGSKFNQIPMDTWLYIGECPSSSPLFAWRAKRVLRDPNAPIWKKRDEYDLVIEQNIKFTNYHRDRKGPIWRDVYSGQISPDTPLISPQPESSTTIAIPDISFIGTRDYINTLSDMARMFDRFWIPQYANRIEAFRMRKLLEKLYGIQEYNKENPYFSPREMLNVGLGTLNIKQQIREGRIRQEQPPLREGNYETRI